VAVNGNSQSDELAKGMVSSIACHAKKDARFMEFCGGHTVAILKSGIRQLLPGCVRLVSGPGCPVCVTDNADLDKAIAVAKIPGVITTSFGDMLRVPGSTSSLQEARAAGSDVRTVYSPLDALQIARTNPDKIVVFIAVGFETTAPGVAASVLQAQKEGRKNYCVLSLHKLCPPVTKALLDSGEVNIQGLICPGHVSAIIGSKPWEFIPEKYGIPCVVSGFEALDILQCIDMLVKQQEKGEARVEIAYKRGVTPDGNQVAIGIMEQVFQPAAASWRGIGELADSGLALRAEFAGFDAGKRLDIKPEPTKIRKGCICGEVLRGVKTPENCPLFRRVCTPANPVGPCMVSSEGSCAAYYNFGGENAG
jgi:hydrogenase expression/formation protein HypD